MSKKLTRRSNVRDPTPRNLRTITLQSPGVVVPAGYMRLLDSPEIGACIDRMVSLIATLPIYLMRNSELGDVRVHDALSRLVDVLPWRYGTRRDWIGWVLTTLLGEGDGNAVCLIRTEGGIPVELLPMPGAALEPINGGLDYRIYWRGSYYDPGDCLHCTLFPDPDYPWRGRGYRVKAGDVADSLAQASVTKSEYLRSEYKPPLIISVDADSDLSDETSREKFEDAYIKRPPGKPWIIPGGLISATTVKPLSLSELAIADTVSLDRKSAATIYGIPPFLVGEGTYNEQEYQAFIRGPVKYICEGIAQELTRKLCTDERCYFKFSARRLYNYDAQAITSIMLSMANQGLVDGNEVRAELDLPPREGLDELRALENYIPVDKSGDQKKLRPDTGAEGEEGS